MFLGSGVSGAGSWPDGTCRRGVSSSGPALQRVHVSVRMCVQDKQAGAGHAVEHSGGGCGAERQQQTEVRTTSSSPEAYLTSQSALLHICSEDGNMLLHSAVGCTGGSGAKFNSVLLLSQLSRAVTLTHN